MNLQASSEFLEQAFVYFPESNAELAKQTPEEYAKTLKKNGYLLNRRYKVVAMALNDDGEAYFGVINDKQKFEWLHATAVNTEGGYMNLGCEE